MPQDDLDPIKALLPRVLGSIAKDSGRAAHLQAVWEDAVGPQIGAQARPERVVEGALVLTVASARWAAELQARAPELCTRLSERLGPRTVERLIFQLEPRRA